MLVGYTPPISAKLSGSAVEALTHSYCADLSESIVLVYPVVQRRCLQSLSLLEDLALGGSS